MDIPLNLLLWGCESWAMTKYFVKKLEVFHMRCLRRILGIKWSDVVDNKISNKKVRTSFNNIRKVKSLIAKRCLLFVGKIIRPNTTVRHSILDYNKTILSLVLINMIILKFE